MSAIQWWAQQGEYEQIMRDEYERKRKAAWEIEYEQWLDDLDQEPYDQFNRSEKE